MMLLISLLSLPNPIKKPKISILHTKCPELLYDNKFNVKNIKHIVYIFFSVIILKSFNPHNVFMIHFIFTRVIFD